MNPQKIISTTAQLIRYDFALEEIEDVWTEDALIDYLVPCINQYLECNLEGLFRVLYRLDIREAAVHAILAPTAQGDPAQELAKIVVAREIEKAKTRIKYSQEEGDGSW
jgi:hypothetical protein